MKLSQLTPQNKATVLGAVSYALNQALGDENLFFTLIVDDTGHLANCTNMNRSAIPRLLREYADQMEKKNGHS